MLQKYTEKELIELFETRLALGSDAHNAVIETAELTGESAIRIGKLIETYNHEKELKEKRLSKQKADANKTKIYIDKERTIKTFGKAKVDGNNVLRVYYMDGRLNEYPYDQHHLSLVKEAVIYQAKEFCDLASKRSNLVVRDYDKDYTKRWKIYLYNFDNIHYVKDKNIQKEINSRIGVKTLQRINVLSTEKVGFGEFKESEEEAYFRSMRICKELIKEAKSKSKKKTK